MRNLLVSYLRNRYHDSTVSNTQQRQTFNRLHPKRKSHNLLEIDSLSGFHSYIRQFPVFKNLVVRILGGDLNNT